METRLSQEYSERKLVLTKANFNSEFREAFKDYALTCGEAGEIVITGVDIVRARPDRQARRQVVVAGQPVMQPIYTPDVRGDRLFERDEKKFEDLKEGKKKLIAKLLSSADKEVRSTLVTSPGYDQIYRNYDILRLWNLTEQVCMGRGAISVYTLVVRLLGIRQTASFHEYDRAFKEAVVDLRAQGNADEILQFILNGMYITSLDQEQFKDKLKPIYGLREWPDYDVLSAELYIYAEATQRMNDLRKDNNGGQIVANVAKANAKPIYGGRCMGKRECWNCGSIHHQRHNCDKEESRCTKCGMYGHLEKYCRVEPGKMSEEKSVLPVRKEKQNANDDRATQPRVAKKGPAKKMTTRSRMLKKVSAHHTTLADDDELDEDEGFIEPEDDFDSPDEVDYDLDDSA